MTLEKIFLCLTGAAFLLLGVAYIVSPAEMMEITLMPLTNDTALIEVRGFYGGQMLGMGLFVLLALRREALAVPALLFIAMALGGTALGRAIGLAVADSAPGVMLGLMMLESASAAIAIWLAWRRSTVQIVV